MPAAAALHKYGVGSASSEEKLNLLAGCGCFARLLHDTIGKLDRPAFDGTVHEILYGSGFDFGRLGASSSLQWAATCGGARLAGSAQACSRAHGLLRRLGSL